GVHPGEGRRPGGGTRSGSRHRPAYCPPARRRPPPRQFIQPGRLLRTAPASEGARERSLGRTRRLSPGNIPTLNNLPRPSTDAHFAAQSSPGRMSVIRPRECHGCRAASETSGTAPPAPRPGGAKTAHGVLFDEPRLDFERDLRAASRGQLRKVNTAATAF